MSTPYMNLTLPVSTVTAGPTYAEQNTVAFETIDAHDHTPGKGTPVPAAGLDIDSNLDIQQNELDDVGAVNLVSQASALPASNVQTVYSISGDLWFNNSSGTAVQITAGNSITSASSPLVPAGVIWPYGGSSAPTGFLLCDGSAISRTTYSDLFSAIGTAYGVGDGSTTFNLPNANGRVPVGSGNYTDPVSGSVTRSLGTSGGAEKHQLSLSELASHNHGGGAHNHTMIGDATGSTTLTSSNNLAKVRSAGDAQDYQLLGTSTSPTLGRTSTSPSIINTEGGNTAHNNMQPYFVTSYIIKT